MGKKKNKNNKPNNTENVEINNDNKNNNNNNIENGENKIETITDNNNSSVDSNINKDTDNNTKDNNNNVDKSNTAVCTTQNEDISTVSEIIIENSNRDIVIEDSSIDNINSNKTSEINTLDSNIEAPQNNDTEVAPSNDINNSTIIDKSNNNIENSNNNIENSNKIDNNNSTLIDNNKSETINNKNSNNITNNSTSNISSNSNNNNINSNNNNNNNSIKIQQQIQQNEILRIQQQQRQQRNIKKSLKKRQEEETKFDFVLQWGSLAFSKLLFFPIEFPVHALTTFIQSHPTRQPIINHTSAATSVAAVSPTLGLFSQLPTPISTSLINLLKYKGYHIYDGGLIYIVHNMLTILINFAQRSFVSIQNSPKNSNNLSQNTIKGVTGSLSLLKYGLTLPLDVIMTRLIVHRFYRRDSQHYINECTFSGVCRNEGIKGLYSCWETIVLKSLLDTIYSKLDDQLKVKRKYQFNQNQHQQQSEKSPGQIILLGVKILLDYILTVIKVRMNIRNLGLFKTLRNIISREGLKGLFSGLNTYFLLFPLWMISILVSTVIFKKIKEALNRSEIPPVIPSPKSSSSSDSVTYYDKDVPDSGLGVAMVSDISSTQTEEELDEEIQENHKIYK